ncbi:MAG: ABC transporter ATP-binding protein [Oscillibacter sp.]|nr:ABC transporter ATP-binding protein [Oscillibacter sp.]
MIEVRNLAAGYRGVPVLKDVNLVFRPGEVLVLAGPNGCGKSTLLRTVAGLQPRLGGEILFDGADRSTLTPRQAAQKAAFMPQSRNVPSITAGRMVLHGRFPWLLSYPRRYQKQDKAIAFEMLSRIGAADLAERSMEELSGGQRQKVYLAMALAQKTETIFMDEPTTYLDIRCQLETMDLAREMAAEGKSVVLVLHDLCMALGVAHRLAVFHQGGMAALGTAEEIYQSGVLREVFGVALGRVETPGGCEYYYQREVV